METQTYTIEDLRQGRVAVINDGTIDDLDRVLYNAFPNDNSFDQLLQMNFFKPNDKFIRNYIVLFFDKWFRDNETDLPTQSVKVFLKEIEQMETKELKVGDNLSLKETKLYSILLSKDNESRVYCNLDLIQVQVKVNIYSDYHSIIVEQGQDKGIQVLIKE